MLNPCHQMARASSVPASGLFSQRQLSPFTRSWTAKLLGHCSGLLESGALSMVNSAPGARAAPPWWDFRSDANHCHSQEHSALRGELPVAPLRGNRKGTLRPALLWSQGQYEVVKLPRAALALLSLQLGTFSPGFWWSWALPLSAPAASTPPDTLDPTVLVEGSMSSPTPGAW